MNKKTKGKRFEEYIYNILKQKYNKVVYLDKEKIKYRFIEKPYVDFLCFYDDKMIKVECKTTFSSNRVTLINSQCYTNLAYVYFYKKNKICLFNIDDIRDKKIKMIKTAGYNERITLSEEFIPHIIIPGGYDEIYC